MPVWHESLWRVSRVVQSTRDHLAQVGMSAYFRLFPPPTLETSISTSIRLNRGMVGVNVTLPIHYDDDGKASASFPPGLTYCGVQPPRNAAGGFSGNASFAYAARAVVLEFDRPLGWVFRKTVVYISCLTSVV